ncbi:hypothetical protein HID58_045586, partial [Brassica napus]
LSFPSINFWMNSAQARSSAHYDPHHSLLCVVSGLESNCLQFNSCLVAPFRQSFESGVKDFVSLIACAF